MDLADIEYPILRQLVGAQRGARPCRRRDNMHRMEPVLASARKHGLALQHVLWWGLGLACAVRLYAELGTPALRVVSFS